MYYFINFFIHQIRYTSKQVLPMGLFDRVCYYSINVSSNLSNYINTGMFAFIINIDEIKIFPSSECSLNFHFTCTRIVRLIQFRPPKEVVY